MYSSKTPEKQKSIKETVEEFDAIFDNSTDEEDLEFEAMAINSDFVHLVTELMAANGIKSRAELARLLQVSPAYISKLFAGDKTFNAKLLAKLQRVFHVRFIFSAHSIRRGKRRK